MNGLCWEAGCSIRGLPPAGAEARRSSTGRCGSRAGGCWEGKRSSWAGGRPSWPGLHHKEEASVGLRGGHSFTEHGEKPRPLPTGEGGQLRALHPTTLARPRASAQADSQTPEAPGSTELGGAFLPSLDLACSAARSCRQSLLTHRGRRWPPSHCQSPWSHQEWQRDGGAGLGFTTLGVKQTKKLRHREAPSFAPFVWETESNLCSPIPGAAGVQRAWATSAHALWV